MEGLQFKLDFSLILIFLQFIKIAYGYEESGQRLDYVSLPHRELKNVTCESTDAAFLCDCRNIDENMFLPPLDGNVYRVIVRNCESLSVGPYLLDRVEGLETVLFQNIRDLILEENSIAYLRRVKTLRRLQFDQVQTVQINSHAIDGNIEEIIFQNGGITKIQTYGITTKSQTGIIKFDSMYIDVIERFAFKKFSLQQIAIMNTVFISNLPSQTFQDMKVQQLLLQNVSFLEVLPLAFHFEEINLLVMRDNHFAKVWSNFISANIKSSILIEKNNFGETSDQAFEVIRQHKDYVGSTKIEFRMNDNQMKLHQTSDRATELRPLLFDSNLNLMLRNLTITNEFQCSIKHNLEQKSFYKQFGDSIYFPSRPDATKFMSVKHILDTQCDEPSYTAYIIGGSIALILVLIAIAAVLIWYLMRKRAAQKLNINDPEPRTYEETQIVMRVENAGLLKTDL